MKQRVLFVDDSIAALDQLRTMLKGQEGVWEMIFVAGIASGIHEIERQSYDAVISYFGDDSANIFALIAAVQKAQPQEAVPIILLTDQQDQVTKRQVIDAGATDLLQRPFDPEDLRSHVRNALRLKLYQDRCLMGQQNLERMVKDRTRELEHSRLDVLFRLGKAAEYRDEETGNHILRVGCYCQIIAEEIAMPSVFCEQIFLAAPLHDIGKIGIPDRILLKPGPLDQAERQLMNQHAAIGFEILMEPPKAPEEFLARFLPGYVGDEPVRNPVLEMAANIALKHHERWDGQGYPLGLAGQRIPLEARITSLADTYDALRSRRPYKEPFSEEKALSIIYELEGTHYDPMVVRAFERCLDDIHNIVRDFADADLELPMSG